MLQSVNVCEIFSCSREGNISCRISSSHLFVVHTIVTDVLVLLQAGRTSSKFPDKHDGRDVLAPD